MYIWVSKVKILFLFSVSFASCACISTLVNTPSCHPYSLLIRVLKRRVSVTFFKKFFLVVHNELRIINQQLLI